MSSERSKISKSNRNIYDSSSGPFWYHLRSVPASRTYSGMKGSPLEIIYSEGFRPSVRVLSPRFVLARSAACAY